MANGSTPAKAPGKKAVRDPKKSAGNGRKVPSRQDVLVAALNAHTDALHRFSSALESVQPFVTSGGAPLGKDDILKVLAIYFDKPDLTTGIKLSVVTAGAFATRAKQINNIKAFKQRGLRLSPNDFDDITSVGDLVDKIYDLIG